MLARLVNLKYVLPEFEHTQINFSHLPISIIHENIQQFVILNIRARIQKMDKNVKRKTYWWRDRKVEELDGPAARRRRARRREGARRITGWRSLESAIDRSQIHASFRQLLYIRLNVSRYEIVVSIERATCFFLIFWLLGSLKDLLAKNYS